MVASVLPRAFLFDDIVEAAPQARVATGAGDVRLSLHRDLAQLKAAWSEFEKTAICTHAQTFVWVEAWQRLVNVPQGIEAAVVVLRGRHGELLAIWPFEITRWRGLRHLRWLGQDHTNYNIGLYDSAFMAGLAAGDANALLRSAVNLIGHVDFARFEQQPCALEGAVNPFSLLPHQLSPSSGHVVTLQKDFAALWESRFGKSTTNSLKRKDKKLRSFGPLEMRWAVAVEERTVVLNEFFRQKTVWFEQEGIQDAFAPGPYRTFYRYMTALSHAAEGLHLAHMVIGAEIVATFIGAVFRGRFQVLMSSLTEQDYRRWSPGLLLMRFQIKSLCEQGLRYYDLGVGENRHKSEWADAEIQLFDSFLPFTRRGTLACASISLTTKAKRFIKSRPTLWSAARAVRRRLRGSAAG